MSAPLPHRNSARVHILARRAALLAAACVAALARPAHAELTLRIADYVQAPKTGRLGSEADPLNTQNSAYLARLNFLAEEPRVDHDRFFVNDLNGPLYILDKTTKQFTEYLNFNGRDGAGIYPRLYTAGGFATGLVTFEFDPDYARNGKFYTVHIEQGGGSTAPSNASFPNLNLANYGVTAAIVQPGAVNYEDVLVEWTDADPTNATFEGTARELLRITARDRIHPMGDIIFNPTADEDHPDWRVMYLAIGDAGAGEQPPGTGGANQPVRRTPQRLDTLGGKILRILPDLAGGNVASTLSDNGKYRIPSDNPFTGVANSAVEDEIYAMGLRNPHRLSWDVDPANPADNVLITTDIGFRTWEEVNFIQRGGNYGYSQREGNQSLSNNNVIGPIPSPDVVTTYLSGSTVHNTVTPIYPATQYGHGLSGQTGPAGDSISDGFVYRGQNIPSLAGKFVFGDITTGQLFWSDFAEMKAAHDGAPSTLAAIHAIDLVWDNPADAAAEQFYTTRLVPFGETVFRYGPMFDVVRAGYVARGGTDENLPGDAAVTGNEGRADIRLQVDAAGELYFLSKSDGVIRYLVEALGDADFNGDDAIDGADFLVWQRHLGQPGGREQGDADGDGRVTAADLQFWRQAMPVAAPPSGGVPEPAAGTLCAFVILVAVRGRRRLVPVAASRKN
jgi:hypothetical protein